MQKAPLKCNGKVVRFPTRLYARWRRHRPLPDGLHETDRSAAPDERLLQQVWFHQRLRRDALRTLDGRPLLVLHPGFWNREAGPDFLQAVLQFGDQPPLTGDVEIDLRADGWHQHQHHANPAYAQVRLHVVWTGPAPAPAGLPILALEEVLDAPLAELRTWFSGAGLNLTPPAVLGACAKSLADLSSDQLFDLLDQAGQIRLERKAAVFQARARQAGWEQAFWEGLFAALGYKQNRWPMHRLGELRPRLLAHATAQPLDPFFLQARLLGVGGLLPSELAPGQPDANRYLRRIWDAWWRDQTAFADLLIPRSLWRFHGLRPANHPARRLALAAHWLAVPGWLDQFEAWLQEDLPENAYAPSLQARLQVKHDPFWSAHWTLRSPRLVHPQPLIGQSRVTDLAMNAILPWLWSRAAVGGNTPLQRRVEQRYQAWPAAQDNAVLRLVRQRLLGKTSLRPFSRATRQQGLIQIVRDFCDRSDALCHGCELPDLVQEALDGNPSLL